MKSRNFAEFVARTLRNRTPQKFAYIFILTLAVFSSSILAQSGTGGIQGTVQDATGAVMPGVSVHVVDQVTGVAADTQSNSAGFYSVPSLFAGSYTLTFTIQGMKQYQTTFTLQVAQTVVINPKMTVGSVTEQVTVSGSGTQLVTYDSPTVSSTLDNTRISQLPANGRYLLTLAGDTTPGLESGGTRVNGLMGEALEYVQDGATLTNRNFGGELNSTQGQLPDPDSVQEVRLETSGSGAQFATPATGIITTKSGTNALHGSIFETAVNNGLGVAKVRQNPANYAAPHYVRNEFGPSVGGPIRIPHLYNGRDKSFFFFAYERYSLRSFLSELVTVPKAEWRTGDYSTLTNSAGVLQTIYDPATSDPVTYQRTPFAGNKVPASRISPFAKKIMDITPAPTSLDNPYVAPNLNTAGINNWTIPTYTFRLDHNFSANNKLFLRNTWINQTQTQLRNFPSASAKSIAADGFPDGATGLTQILVTTISAAAGYTHIFSPTFVSETNVSQQWFQQYVVGGGNPNLNYEAMLGLPNNFGEVGFPTINGGSMPYGGTQFNYKENQIITNLDENLTKIKGKHQVLFGGRYRHERFGYLSDRNPDVVNFGAGWTADLDPATGANYGPKANTGNGNADLLLGGAYSYTVSLNAPFVHYRDMEFDSYIQDNWHVSKNLTINAGLRWEIHPAPETGGGVAESFDLARKAVVLPNPISTYIQQGLTTQAIVTNLQNLGVVFETPSQAGIPQALLYNYDRTFAPRVGFAYAPIGGKYGTVIRAGYGRYIYPAPVRNSLRLTAANPPFNASYTQSYLAANQSPDGLPNYVYRGPQSVVAGVNSQNVVNSSTINSILPGVVFNTLDPHYAPDVVTEVNATVEQPLKGSMALRITYSYNHGANLDQDNLYNNHPSTYVWEVVNGVVPPLGQYAATAQGPYDQTTYGGNYVSQKTGYSNNNSLQVNLQRVYKKGLAFQGFWNFSRAFRVGGNWVRDGEIRPASNYLPGLLPGTDFKTLNRFENYQVDGALPAHHFGFNGVVDIPFGTGKKFFGKANRFWNEVVGGFQIAGTGQVLVYPFQVGNSNWGATSPIHVYRNGLPITDCRSGVCYKEKLWFNGYIAPSSINAATNGVSGLPSDYTPYEAPINNVPGIANYGNNNVPVTLKNGSVVQVAYSPGPIGANKFSHTFILGPRLYNADLSLFKIFPITEKVNLRVNVDAFNAFNIQGNPYPNGADGTENFRSSFWPGRQIQLTARLTF